MFWTRPVHGLSIAQTFVTLAVVAIVSEPLAMALLAIPFFSSSLASLSRMQDFLSLEEHTDTRNSAPGMTEVIPGGSSSLIRVTNMSVVFDGLSALFSGVNMQISVGNVAMISGPVGCGKSTLLKTLIGEVGLNIGVIEIATHPIAYASQTPWLQNRSIRDNIIGRSVFRSTWYNRVVYACALDIDLNALPAGDHTVIGTGGTQLSGGQKQRLVRFAT